MSGPDLYLAVRAGKLLLRGTHAQHCAITISNEQHEWSNLGRGWVVDSDLLPDALAYAQSSHLLAVVSDLDRKEKSA